MNLAEAYGRLAEQAEKASSADARIKPTTGGDHQEYHSDWGKEADIVGHIVGQAATTPTIIITLTILVADAVAFEPVSRRANSPREINSEFCKIWRSATNLRARTRANPMASRKIPYAIEQGIF